QSSRKDCNIVLLSTLLLFTNLRITSGACDTGWFGSSCQYKCHCANNQCDVDGKCTGGSTCVRGWFGPLCQYQDLTTVQPGTTTSNTIVTDGDDMTCARVQTFTVSWDIAYQVKWLRVVLYEADSLQNVQVNFKNNSGADIACTEQTLVRVYAKVTDIFCSNNILAQQVVVDFKSYKNVCSILMSGGRNLALRQPTWQSGNYSEGVLIFDSTRAVDGNPSSDFFNEKSCTHTKTESPGSWRVTFTQPLFLNRYVLYNRDSSRQRLKGFTLTSYSSTHNKLFYYQDTHTGNNVTIYNVTTTTPTTPVSYVVVNVSDILTLCEVEANGDFICTSGTFGLECANTCNCNDPTETCFVATGGCRSGCAVGYQGEGCVEVCDSITGECSSCVRGFQGPHCEKPCNATYQGESCKQTQKKDYSKGMKDGIGIGIGIGTMCGVFIISIAVICLVWRLKRTTHSNGNAKNNYSNQVLELGDGLTSPEFNSKNENTKVYDYINESPEITLQEATNEASITSTTYNSLKNEYNDDSNYMSVVPSKQKHIKPRN
ncbi:uncharacterized protein LOC131953958, partial [Physella acuta]|uniref:uncharacterized protein LOC131953958 n=1 Tax=Physella acuta TaxID=109671 RepID=UPI0027DC891C